MKRFFITILSTTFLFLGCGDEKPEDLPVQEQAREVQDSIKIIQGEFIYLSDAAVLKGPDFIYGVKIDSLSLELADRVAHLKKNDFEMIPVKVKAKVIPNPSPQGWEEYIEIKNILQVSEEKVPDTALIK